MARRGSCWKTIRTDSVKPLQRLPRIRPKKMGGDLPTKPRRATVYAGKFRRPRCLPDCSSATGNLTIVPNAVVREISGGSEDWAGLIRRVLRGSRFEARVSRGRRRVAVWLGASRLLDEQTRLLLNSTRARAGITQGRGKLEREVGAGSLPVRSVYLREEAAVAVAWCAEGARQARHPRDPDGWAAATSRVCPQSEGRPVKKFHVAATRSNVSEGGGTPPSAR
jgi:hypothetical protein